MVAGSASSMSPRAQLAVPCRLRRRVGSPIDAHTVDVGPDGMRVRSTRPLAEDEVVAFDLPDLDMRIAGHARVCRQQRMNVYALRFEGLPAPMSRRLHALAINAR